MYKTTVSCALMLFSGCLIGIKNIRCSASESEINPNNEETTTSSSVSGKESPDIVNTPKLPDAHTTKSPDATSAVPDTTLSGKSNGSEHGDESSVANATHPDTNLSNETPAQGSNSTKVDATTSGAHVLHSRLPPVSSLGTTPSLTANQASFTTSAETKRTPTLTVTIVFAFLLAILVIVLLYWCLRKKSKRYSFDLYHKSSEDANIPLNSVQEDNDNVHISSEEKTNSNHPESSLQTTASENSTKVENVGDSADK
ncbi:uncharacterized protein LOC115090581 [Rhinatrema bivittatum]|uniref:uncharacterized protein LOC115090581 n=1 Tax=Rhinatrema bivittatum TaxID=194408 RepID=UPI00112699E2|nr:uncharacterized protein LOC115090581 [Rhinatrema bivittatum]